MTSSEQTVPREAGPGETAAAAYDGLFLAFEGGDGAGKSTQLALLRQWLESLGRTVVVTREACEILTLLASEEARARQLLTGRIVSGGDSPETEGVRAHT